MSDTDFEKKMNEDLFDRYIIYDNAIQFQGKSSANTFVILRNGATVLFNDGRPPANIDENTYNEVTTQLLQESLVSDKVQRLKTNQVPARESLTQAQSNPVSNFFSGITSFFSRSTESVPTAPVVAEVETGVSTGAAPAISTVRAPVSASAQTLRPAESVASQNTYPVFFDVASVREVPTQVQPENKPFPAKTYVNSNQYTTPCSTRRASYRASILDAGKLQEIRAKDALRKRRSRECRRSRGLQPW